MLTGIAREMTHLTPAGAHAAMIKVLMGEEKG
jgi:hypothetical protein